MVRLLEVLPTQRDSNKLSLAEFQTRVLELGNVDTDGADTDTAGFGSSEIDFAELDSADRIVLVVESGFDH